MEKNAHAAEKVPDEDDQLPGRNVWRVVELFERSALALGVEYEQITHARKVFLGRQVVGDVDGAFELFLLLLQYWRCAGR